MPHHFNDDDPDHNDYIGSTSSNPYQGTGRFGSGGTDEDEDEEGISNEESARRNQGTGTNPDNPYQGTGSFNSGGTGADTSPGEGAGEPAPTHQQLEDEERGSKDWRRRRRDRDQPGGHPSESQEPQPEAVTEGELEPPSHWNAQNGGEENDGLNTPTLPNLPGAVPGSVNNPVLTEQGTTLTDNIDTATTGIATDSSNTEQLQSISDEIDALEAREEFGFVELTGTEKERLEELKTQRDKLTGGGSATGRDQAIGKKVIGRKLVGYDGQGEPIYEPVYETIPAITASSGETTGAGDTATEETKPVSRADFGGTEVGTIDTTPTDPTNAPETAEGADVDTRPDGEYHDGDSYAIVSTDSNGNRHISKYRVEKDGEVRFGDNYLEEQAIERPDGGTTIRFYVHPELKSAIDALEAKSGTAGGLTVQEQQQLPALQGQRNEMSGQVWNEVWDTPETRKVAEIAVQVELAGRILTGSSSIGEQRAFNLKKVELLAAIQNLPNATLRERYSQHYGRLLDTTRGDWIQANYQHGSDTDMAQAEANLNLAIERFAAAGGAIPLGTNTTPEFQQARNELVRALNAIPGEEARAVARAKVVSILEKQGSDFVTEKIAAGSDFTETFDQSAFLEKPTDAIPPHSLLSSAGQSHIDVQQRVADILEEDLTADNYYERRASFQEANTEYGNAVDEYDKLKADLESLDGPTAEQIAEVQSTLGSLLETQSVLIAWGEHLDTFYEGNTEAIALAEGDSADRSDFVPQYEYIDPSRPEQKIENLGDWNSIAFDLTRAQKVLGAIIADLDRRIKEYEQGGDKDWAVGNALREESARLAAESHFQNQVSDQLFQTVTGQERTGDKEADDRTFDLGWQRFSARDVNPYTPHGEAIRRYNLYSETPISQMGLTGEDHSDDEDDRTIYHPEFAAYYGEVTGERVSGNPEQDNATLDLALAALDDQLENEFVGTGKVYQQRVLYDAEGNFTGVDPRFASAMPRGSDFYDPGEEGEKAEHWARLREAGNLAARADAVGIDLDEFDGNDTDLLQQVTALESLAESQYEATENAQWRAFEEYVKDGSPLLSTDPRGPIAGWQLSPGELPSPNNVDPALRNDRASAFGLSLGSIGHSTANDASESMLKQMEASPEGLQRRQELAGLIEFIGDNKSEINELFSTELSGRTSRGRRFGPEAKEAIEQFFVDNERKYSPDDLAFALIVNRIPVFVSNEQVEKHYLKHQGAISGTWQYDDRGADYVDQFDEGSALLMRVRQHLKDDAIDPKILAWAHVNNEYVLTTRAHLDNIEEEAAITVATLPLTFGAGSLAASAGTKLATTGATKITPFLTRITTPSLIKGVTAGGDQRRKTSGPYINGCRL